MKYLLAILFSISVCSSLFSQVERETLPDSLLQKSYVELFEKFQSNYEDTVASKLYLKAYYRKAVEDNDALKKAVSLTYLSYYQEKEEDKIVMLDRSIDLSNKFDNIDFPVLSYSFKGGYFLDQGNYSFALENYLKALEFAEQHNNELYIYITKHNIAIIKGDIGKFDEALKLIKECFEFEKEREKVNLYDYSESLLYLSEAYLRTKKYDSAHIYISEGLEKTKDTLPYLQLQFILNEGIYFQKTARLDDAERSFIEVNNTIDSKNSESIRTFTLLYSYLGKNQILSNDPELAKDYFLKLDSIFIKENLVIPELREGYEHLVKYFERKKDYVNQLKHINTLLKVDSIYYSNGIVVNNQLYKEYDTPELIKDKEKIVKHLTEKTAKLNYFLYSAFSLVGVVILLLIFQYKKQRTYRKRFNDLVSKNISNPSDSKKQVLTKNREINLPPDVIDLIANKLSQFESQKGYLKKGQTKFSLAKQLDTNTKYLSKVISYKKEKTFTQYINGLRINDAVSELKNNTKLRQYTIQSVAEEFGFNTAESFSSAFRKHTGIKPSYFIKQLESRD